MKTRAILIALMAVLAITGTGCNPRVASVSLYMGDSLVALSADMLVAKALNTTDGATLPVVNGISGSSVSMPYWAPRIVNIQERVELDYAFVSLGSNDMANGTTPVRATVTANAVKVMEAFDPSVTVYWVLPSHAQQPVYVPMVRAALKDAAQGFSNVVMVDFEGYLRTQGLELSDVLGADGIHWNATGEQQYGEFFNSLRGH